MTAKITTFIGLLGLVSLGCDARTAVGVLPNDASTPDNFGPGLVDAASEALAPVGNSGHTCTPPPYPGDQPFELPPEVEGIWTGYLEGGAGYGLSSDAVRLTLERATDGTSQIHIAYGSTSPPPPATSATTFYPPGYRSYSLGIVDGFPYRAHNVNWQPFGPQWRLRFVIDLTEPWGSWCQLQTSYPQSDGSYSCIPPNRGFGGGSGVGGSPGSGTCQFTDPSGQQMPIPCAQLTLCTNYSSFQVCACDACGCDMQGVWYTGVPSSGPGYRELLFDAGLATGSGIRLMRAAN